MIRVREAFALSHLHQTSLLFVNSKLEESQAQNCDLMQVISKREETIHTNQVRLEDKSRECTVLTRQLEEALEEARRQVCVHVMFGMTRCSRALAFPWMV